MVRENRIKNIDFPIGSLTSSAGGIIDIYSERPINGRIKKVILQAGNYTATGSVEIRISGAASEVIFSLTSGTSQGMTTQNNIWYPQTLVSESTGPLGVAATSGGIWTDMVADSTINIIGSGLGNGKSGLGLTVYYI